jgi:site-specific DNA-methyltransferase (adenine-specific)
MSEAQVILGDSLEALKQMDSEIFDLVLSDPPYMEYKTSHRKDKESKLSQPIIYQDQRDQVEAIRECIRVLKMDRAFFLFTNWEQDWWMQKALGTLLRNKIIWVKNNWSAGDLKGSFGNQYEEILLGVKGRWEYKGKREPDVWNFDRVEPTSRIHPTEKPVELYHKIIENSTDEGDWILDSYGGSGSSAIAALELNRNILVYEIDEEYHSRILRRIDEHQHST